jgi:hypothetical protein
VCAAKCRQSPAKDSGEPFSNPVSACLSAATPRIIMRLVLGHKECFLKHSFNLETEGAII